LRAPGTSAIKLDASRALGNSAVNVRSSRVVSSGVLASTDVGDVTTWMVESCVGACVSVTVSVRVCPSTTRTLVSSALR
jgi:hypothetical protein